MSDGETEEKIAIKSIYEMGNLCASSVSVLEAPGARAAHQHRRGHRKTKYGRPCRTHIVCGRNFFN